MRTLYVLVTTDEKKRGVFAGILESQDADRVVLVDAQMCVYWSAETHGVLGLAAQGPAAGSRIGPRVPRIELVGVTSITDMTNEAAEAWHAEPWTT